MSSKNNIKKFLKKIIPFKYDLDVRESIQDVIKNKSEYLSSDTNLSNKEKNILENILSINKLKVSDVMIPRASIVSISHNCKLEEIVSVIEKETHSRIPVYRKDLDDVLGMVHIKDVIKFYSNKIMCTLLYFEV